jgi:hypothetical protein
MQIAAGTIVASVFLLVQLQAKPYRNSSDDLLASASSFSLVMVFLCSIFYKYAALTDEDELVAKMYVLPSCRLPLCLPELLPPLLTVDLHGPFPNSSHTGRTSSARTMSPHRSRSLSSLS